VCTHSSKFQPPAQKHEQPTFSAALPFAKMKFWNTQHTVCTHSSKFSFPAQKMNSQHFLHAAFPPSIKTNFVHATHSVYTQLQIPPPPAPTSEQPTFSAAFPFAENNQTWASYWESAAHMFLLWGPEVVQPTLRIHSASQGITHVDNGHRWPQDEAMLGPKKQPCRAPR
jgi:hypothetical protein